IPIVLSCKAPALDGYVLLPSCVSRIRPDPDGSRAGPDTCIPWYQMRTWRHQDCRPQADPEGCAASPAFLAPAYPHCTDNQCAIGSSAHNPQWVPGPPASVSLRDLNSSIVGCRDTRRASSSNSASSPTRVRQKEYIHGSRPLARNGLWGQVLATCISTDPPP